MNMNVSKHCLKEVQEERNKRNIQEDEDEPAESEKSWKKKKLNWLKTVSKTLGVVPVSRVQVVELYSPERVNKVAKEYGMETGLGVGRKICQNRYSSLDPRCVPCFRNFRP